MITRDCCLGNAEILRIFSLNNIRRADSAGDGDERRKQRGTLKSFHKLILKLVGTFFASTLETVGNKSHPAERELLRIARPTLGPKPKKETISIKKKVTDR
jgi:hypothetical protein